jgi:hypothetical protein
MRVSIIFNYRLLGKRYQALLSSNNRFIAIYLSMLGKILLTLAVTAIMFFVLRQRQIADSEEFQSKDSNSPTRQAKKRADTTLAKDLRIGAYLFLILMVGLGGVLYYFQWRDDRLVLTINLYRTNQAKPTTYEVYQYQLNERSFVTTDGVTVTVAGDERMEVLELDR